jgi:hypothetical protein
MEDESREAVALRAAGATPVQECEGKSPSMSGKNGHMTIVEAEARYSAAWGTPATVVPYRISGNRYVYAVTDHNGHWVPLHRTWIGGDMVLSE